MKNYLLALLLLSGLSAQAPAATFSSNLEGDYECTGTDEEHPNMVFKGEMVIKKTGQTYSVNSSFSDNASYIGTGIYDKKKRTIALVFVNSQNTKETGISVMNIQENGAMTTDWTYLNRTTIGHSTCTAKKGTA
ncbi:hypothetical protein [Legionella micdadei]|uniref:Uncharacterized protein n=1 Tax=Legionella micdadei TaxID=451 RepID=A0A098GES2_LEGMI|nr:hypothetical protein [Legionella micdadei]ARG98341.1 hypothetical protein B6N58_12080 [Legionella micdadei]ARH01093.1 hypothetical protein B6V88_12085 [Legionella micdadei]KTD27272.1 hypothetical protein Lmic_2207 [Legionella micdadei]NSL18658.1 hypothetical protein [Legionella micdadei]CEG59986.1 exported protein of unknown function [Legionella micdadei]